MAARNGVLKPQRPGRPSTFACSAIVHRMARPTEVRASMIQFDRWKTLAILAACLASLRRCCLLQGASGDLAIVPAEEAGGARARPQGRRHLLYELKVEDIKQDWLKTLREDARKRLLDAKIGHQARPAIVAGRSRCGRTSPRISMRRSRP